ncbi:MAG TPA: hypothetical protein VHN99_05320 [Deinococcales bacterium]|nr:hypothetical protein [Deinococcales bacterium]
MIVVSLIVIAVGVWLYVSAGPAHSGARSLEAHVEAVDYPADGARSATVVLNLGVAALRLSGGGRGLLRGTVQLPARMSRERGLFSGSGETRLELRQHGTSAFWPVPGAGASLWDLTLGGQVPVSLTVQGGVGDVFLDLRDTLVSNVTVQGGVGRVTLTLPAGTASRVSVAAGVGSVHVIVPRDLDARVEARSGVGSLDISGPHALSGNSARPLSAPAGAPRSQVNVRGGVGHVRLTFEDGPTLVAAG